MRIENKMTYYVTTYDLSEFGYRELIMVKDLLEAYLQQGYPANAISDTGIKPSFNKNSGCVWLESEDYDCAMLNEGKLELWLNSPYSSLEGFLGDLIADAKAGEMEDAEDLEWLIGQMEAASCNAEEIAEIRNILATTSAE